MTLKPYYSTDRSINASRKRRGRVACLGGSTAVLISLMMLAVVPAPEKFIPLSIRQRTLAVVDPTDYFKDRPDDYYQSLRQSTRRVQEEASGAIDNGPEQPHVATNGETVYGVPFPEPRVGMPFPEPRVGIPFPEPRVGMPFPEPRIGEGNAVSSTKEKKGRNPEVVIITPTAPPVSLPPVRLVDKPSAAPVDLPTKAPTSPPTSPPTNPPTTAPMFTPTNAPVVPPTDPPTDPPTAVPSVLLVLAPRVEGAPPSLQPSPAPQVPLGTRPNVYSFYTQRESNLPELDDALIEKWKSAWERAGYNPKVLDTETAAQHPEYRQYKSAIDSVLATSSVSKPKDLVPCYLRYLAMTVVGGGMMVDLDMTPKSVASESNAIQDIPDKFTLYCNFDTADPKADWVKQVETQSGLPCAAMAGADEWYRIGKLMGWVAQTNFDQSVWTDAHALQFMKATGDVKMQKKEVAQSWRTSGWDRCHFRYV